MANIDIYFDEIRELQKRIEEYIEKGLHPVHARNKARKDMRKQIKKRKSNIKEHEGIDG